MGYITLPLTIAIRVIQGLAYLHKSPIKYHGFLKPTRCLIDNQLGLKIAGVGHERITAELLGLSTDAAAEMFTENLWMAPEVAKNSHPTASGDMFSFAVISHHILTEEAELNVRDMLLQYSNSAPIGKFSVPICACTKCGLKDGH